MSPAHGRRPHYRMAPCRPEYAHAECADCMRMRIPAEHLCRSYRRIPRMVLDVRAIVGDVACPLRVVS